ncbi:MAG: GIY-YIG nuclease family protein [Dysgonamonadaceae bacterium]|nr:GIY-YIG nuclease family protein [Dysgonamonadaceae bacterium]
MSKYTALKQFLLSSSQDCINMTFLELERILGFDLPKSAYTYEAWWANGGHSQANAWLDAGYKVKLANTIDQTVCFYKADNISKQVLQPKTKSLKTTSGVNTTQMLVDSTMKTLRVFGYEFCYIQQLIPDCDVSGSIIKYYPQNEYDNKKGLLLSHFGKGAFCRFSINAGDCPGVYLWVVDDSIIYIGETENLKKRFNMGYGRIAPRNCYIGGQSTNCKMNKVILNLYEQGKTVSLYFYNTTDYKRIELELLRKIDTKYNVKRYW